MLAALAPLTLWAVPATHPRAVTRVRWYDRVTWIALWIEVEGFDRHGWVDRTWERSWTAPTRAALNPVRQAHAAGRLTEWPPTESWRPQFSDYGNNHVYLPGGVELIDDGKRHVLPYHAVAAVLAAPGLAWVATLAWDRRRPRRPELTPEASAGPDPVSRTPRPPRPWAASSTAGGPTGTGPGRPG